MTYSSIANAGIYKDGCARHCCRAPGLLQFASVWHVHRPVIISGSCRWHRMHWSLGIQLWPLPELYAKLREHVVPLNCVANCSGYQWSNVSTTTSQFWLTRRGRADVHHIWHLLLVAMCHLVHWDCRTNICVAVLTRPSSWRQGIFC